MDYDLRTRYGRGNSSGYRGYGGSRGSPQGGSQGGSRGGHWGRSQEQNGYGLFNRYQKAPAVAASPRPAFGPLIRSIMVSDIDVKDENMPAVITDCELVGSYNWLDSKSPLILIPGGPPRWTPLAQALPLQGDSGTYFRDINSARLPLHPMEPVAHAVCKGISSQKGADLDIDIVACGYTFGNLLRFIRRDELEPGGCKPFRLVAQLIGSDDESKEDGKSKATLFLVRRENAPDECIPGISGFGHTFPEAYTTWDAATRKSKSHQRLIKYRFGGLNILLRSEADGYFHQTTQKASSGAVRPAAEKTGIDDIDNLFASFGMGSQAASSPVDTAETEDSLQVQHGGSSQPQSAIFDIKTRSIWKKEQHDEMLDQEMPRLWCRQMPTFILAFHRKGVFAKEDIEIIDVRQDITKWEQDHQESLQKLAELLQMILAQVKVLPRGKKLEICHTEGDGADECLEFREPGPGAMDALSEKGRRLWMGQDDDGDDVDGSAHVDEDEDEDDESDSRSYNGRFNDDSGWSDADLEELDYTACSSSDCGYCGKCPY
ncbi:geranylgeranyl pyrophosphate synthetase [Ophiostoma piceae UAMH 11346]|uniref:Geranylgeranyl pyrophosphate synthetase n=1 Tax=Ophiostoma piceae (strain UAMH 11346) TaxID=1262450 RepID=S3BTV4_OPHP1|nr:geranylgeranyl pyrophosphate synthetase [Ophiostoma piceae UAMH 11346]